MHTQRIMLIDLSSDLGKDMRHRRTVALKAIVDPKHRDVDAVYDALDLSQHVGCPSIPFKEYVCLPSVYDNVFYHSIQLD